MTSSTDNRMTELLREGLTERGIEWRSGLEGVTFVGDWCFVEYDNGKLAATCEPALTPEQAIAATLGSGTLTAEQVREAIERHVKFYEGGDYDEQVIADELNAELGSGTCENIAPEYLDFLCSECGFVHYHSDENDSGDGNDWAFCPNCGRKVVSE